MEPVSLTCPKCAASWKVIKAGSGPITCPKCKAALAGTAVAASSESPPEPATAKPSGPAATPKPPPDAAALPGLTPVPLPAVADTDDPALRADYDDRTDRRRGMPPLLKVAVILLLLFILVPLAAFVLFAIVCAVMIARS